MATLAAIIRFSMMSRARSWGGTSRSITLPPGHDGPRLDRLQVEQAVPAPQRAQALGGFVLEPDLLLEAGHRRHLRRHAGAALEPGAHRVVGELGPAVDERAVDVVADDRAPGADVHLDDHRRRGPRPGSAT